MKKVINLVVLFFVLVTLNNAVQAKSIFNNPLRKAIKKSDISRSAFIAASFKSLDNDFTVFAHNDQAPMSPASTQKLVTLLPSINTLGENYEFKTQLYKNKNDDLYLKLGADPLLNSCELKGMIKTLHDYKIAEVKNFYIDDSVVDSVEWGEGWQWDNDLNPLMPKFGAYNLDSNLLIIVVSPTVKGAPAEITTTTFYPTAFMNNVVTGNSTNVTFERKNFISPDVITANGTISKKDLYKKIPINYPRRYFVLRLEEVLRKQKISYFGDFDRKATPSGLSLVSEVKHPLSTVCNSILKQSNNMMAETTFKVAGGKYENKTGSIEAAKKMFDDYYKKQGINTDKIKITDGSGVSKNNLLTADFMTEVLLKESKNKDFETFKSYMASPGEGTLTYRMLYFKDNIKAKTGTLQNVSAIAGYLTAKSGKTYAFCIMINDPKSKSADKKAFEEYFLREAFNTL